MGIFDAINVAESAMSVHRFRSEVAAENIANVYDPGHKRKEVDLASTNFSTALDGARAGIVGGGSASSISRGDAGAVRVANVRTVEGSAFDERQQAFLGVTEMMQAKSAFELNVRSASMLKSMALSSLEIGRGA